MHTRNIRIGKICNNNNSLASISKTKDNCLERSCLKPYILYNYPSIISNIFKNPRN